MKTKETEILKNILEHLQNLDPPVKKIAVESQDPSMTMAFIDLAEVCYITSKSDSGRQESMFVTKTNEHFYNNMTLKNLEIFLAGHPHFLRTSKSTIINLTKVRGFSFSNARDLWFEGLEESISNAVTNTYLKKFEAYFE
jgi:DNA-binding LytR/AlgR family response regulator